MAPGPHRRRRRRRKPSYDLREISSAILYVNRTGIAWRYLPHDFPPWPTVYHYFTAWTNDGIFTQLNYDLTGLVRTQAGREATPTADVIDTQSVKTSSNVPLHSQGVDAGQKIVGRKRGVVTDTLGLLLAVIVTAASASDNTIGIDLLDQAKAAHRDLTKTWVDAGFKNKVIEHGATLGIDVEVVTKDPQIRGSPWSNAGGSWSGRSDGSCSTDAWPATTKPSPATPPA